MLLEGCCIMAVQVGHHDKHMISIAHIARHVTLAQTATMLIFSACQRILTVLPYNNIPSCVMRLTNQGQVSTRF